MHPTDDLVALGQVRMARAAAAGPRLVSSTTSTERLRDTINRLHQEALSGPRPATQPTLKTNAQHIARRDPADRWASLHTAARSGEIGDPAQRLRDTHRLNAVRSANQAVLDLAYAIEADI